MDKLRRRLPSLSGLVIFEAAARRLSFTAAAREMYITQAAVSRQIRQLELFLGTPLFVREHRMVRLTAAGQRLHEAVGQGLERIAQVTGEIGAGSYGSLTVTATVAFATYWLIPRLDIFQQAHPEIGIRLLAMDREVDVKGENIDIAFTSGGEGQAANIRLERLFDENLIAVCAADYLEGRVLTEPSELAAERLLELDREHWRYFHWPVVDWLSWFEQTGYVGAVRPSALAFNNYQHLINAAIEGRGVAMGCTGMLQDCLDDGRLVRPMEHEYRTARAYHLAMNPAGANPAAMHLFRDWWQENLPHQVSLVALRGRG